MGVPAKRYFRINMDAVETILGDRSRAKASSDDSSSLPRTEQSSLLDPSLPRTKQSVLQRTKQSHINRSKDKKNIGGGKPARVRENSKTIKTRKKKTTGLISDDWDLDGGKHLRQILEAQGSDLVIRTENKRAVDTETLANNFYKLRIERGVSKARILKVMHWLREHHSDEYTPRMHKACDFSDRWQRFEEAMIRWCEKNGESAEPKEVTKSRMRNVNKVRNWLSANTDWDIASPPWKDDLAKAMKALGLTDKDLDPEEV